MPAMTYDKGVGFCQHTVLLVSLGHEAVEDLAPRVGCEAMQWRGMAPSQQLPP